MKRTELRRASDPAYFANDLVSALEEAPLPEHHHGPSEVVRTDHYKGHDITVKTTYEITIDGQSIPLHVHVGNDGSVHVHSLPNYIFGSALAMVRRLIDQFPDALFDPETDRGGDSGHGHMPDHQGRATGRPGGRRKG